MTTAQRAVAVSVRGHSGIALLGTLVVIGGGVMIGLLHTTAGRLDPLSQPLSQYALTSAAWLFDSGVMVVALGLGILVGVLVSTRRMACGSAESVAMLLCIGGLITLTLFPDRSRHGALALVGWIHSAASLLAFSALPIAPILLGHRHRRARGCSVLPSAARVLAIIAAVLSLVLIVGSVVQREIGGAAASHHGRTPFPEWEAMEDASSPVARRGARDSHG